MNKKIFLMICISFICIIFICLICIIAIPRKPKAEPGQLQSGTCLLRSKGIILSVDKKNKLLRVSPLDTTGRSLLPKGQTELTLQYNEVILNRQQLEPGKHIEFGYFHTSLGTSPLRVYRLEILY